MRRSLGVVAIAVMSVGALFVLVGVFTRQCMVGLPPVPTVCTGLNFVVLGLGLVMLVCGIALLLSGRLKQPRPRAFV